VLPASIILPLQTLQEVAINYSEARGAGDVERSLLRPARLMRRLLVGSVNSKIKEELILMLIR
jgi:hypothetical protein